MKWKDYIYLAKTKQKTHKKSNRTTVAGLAIGFIILIPIIVALLGLNVSVNNQFNKIPYALFGEAGLSDYRIPSENNFDLLNLNLSGSKNIDYFTENNKCSTIIYERHAIPSPNTMNTTSKISLGDSEYKDTAISATPASFYNIIDMKKSDSLFPQNLLKYYPNGIFMNGYNQGFTDLGKKQVIVSQKFLEMQGYSPSTAYKNTLTLYAQNSFTQNDNQELVIDGYVCKNYEIVGIIKSEVTDMYSYENTMVNFSYMSADLFFTDVNVYDSNGIGMLKPTKTVDRKTGKSILTYANLTEKETLNEEYMMLGLSKNSIHQVDHSSTLFSTCIYLESSSYSNLLAANKSITAKFGDFLPNSINKIITTSNIFESYTTIRNVTNMISLVLLLVGIVVALCAIINLYSSLKHNVNQRKFYLATMRAIGAKDTQIVKLYFFNALTVIAKAGIYILIFGLALSVGIKFALDAFWGPLNLIFKLSISWNIIILCLVSTVAFLYSLGIIFAYICTYGVVKKPIMEILNQYQS